MNNKKRAIALGNFDGIHKGHTAVIKAAVQAARQWDMIPTVLILRPLTSSVIDGREAPALLTEADKDKLFADMGVEVVRIDFLKIKDYAPQEFYVKILAGELNAGMLSCGFNYRFGKGGEGDSTLLGWLCEITGVMLRVTPSVSFRGEAVSSTRIRAAIEGGDIELANEMLGREFGYTLEVVHGDHLGRSLDCPTINQLFPEGLIVPKYGVYASRTCVDGEWYRSVTNIGRRPSFENDEQRSETHIIGYDGDLYGKFIEVRLQKYKRGEMKFESLDELKAQLEKDKM